METYKFTVRRIHEIDIDIEAESYEEAIAELKKVNISQEEIERPNCVEEVVMNDKGEVIENFFFDTDEWNPDIMKEYIFIITKMDWPARTGYKVDHIPILANSKDNAIAQVTNQYVFGSKTPPAGTFQVIEFEGEVLSSEIW